MPTFGVVCEGKTDFPIIEHLVLLALDDLVDVEDIRPVQPPLDATGASQTDFGGWQLVLKFLELRKYREALQANSHLIVHVDTDVCEHPGFSVSTRDGSGPLPVALLVEAVAKHLTELIAAEDRDLVAGRIVFAIAVDTAECWMMPLLFSNRKAAKKTGCFDAINAELARRNRKTLGSKQRRNQAAYDSLACEFLKHDAHVLGARNPSLGIFVDRLKAVRGGIEASAQDPGPA